MRGNCRIIHTLRTRSGIGFARPESFHDGSVSDSDPDARRKREDDDERRQEEPEREDVGIDAGHVLLEDHLDDPERDPDRDRQPEDPHASDHRDQQRLHEERDIRA